MKWLLGILAAVVIVPVLAIAAWQQWGKTLPREPMVNCDHVPYLRAQIGDTLLTIPRRYADTSTRKGSNDSTTGDFLGRCQTENDPPVKIESMTLDSSNPDFIDENIQGKNLAQFFPYVTINFYEVKEEHTLKLDMYEMKEFGGGSYIKKWGEHSAVSFVIFDQKYPKLERSIFYKKVETFLWALRQPPEAGLVTPDGDFDLAKLRQKENAS